MLARQSGLLRKVRLRDAKGLKKLGNEHFADTYRPSFCTRHNLAPTPLGCSHLYE
jgi:hypothetical protein